MFRWMWLAVCAFTVLCARTPEYALHTWRTQDGLPQNRIQSLAQTPDGYLWIGTPAGLARFDGLQFKTFDRSNTPVFRDDSILSLCVGRHGTLWIGTEGGGLMRYQRGSFTIIPAADGLSNQFVRALLEDALGNLWIGTDRGYFLRGPSGVIRRLDGTAGIPVSSVSALRQDARGRIWAASNQGALVATGQNVELFRPVGVPASRGPTLLPMPDGSVWLYAPGALWKVSDRARPVKVSLGDLQPRSLHPGDDGQLWLGTIAGGLVQIRGDRLIANAEPSLPDQTILAIFTDREQNLWIGTQDGLTRITRSRVETVSRRHGLPSDNVITVFEDTDGSTWFGAITGPMSRMRQGSSKPVPVPAPAKEFHPRMVFRARNGDLWYGSNTDGVARVHHGRVRIFTRQHGLRTNAVRQFLEDRQGRIWVALGSGLALFNGDSLRTFYVEDGLPYGGVRSLLELPDGDILVGTDGGVGRIRDRRFVTDKSLDPLRGEKIWTMVAHPSSGVWIGTRGAGIFRLRDGVLRQVTVHDGLPGNSIYQMIDDRQGNLWVTGSFGLMSVPWREIDAFASGQRVGLSVATWGPADGLRSTEMSLGISPAAAVSRSGELWFATVKGAVRIRPDQPRPVRRLQVLIEGVRAGDEEFLPGAPISIAPGRKRIEIAYTACDLLAPAETRFRYKLEGFDSGWNFESQRRAAVYTNLPPGSYKFRVASLGAGLSESDISFSVQPHFTQTWLFQAALVVAVLLLLVAIFVAYDRQTRARWTIRLAERARLAREMHDTLIQGCVGISALLEASASASGTQRNDLVDEARKQIRLTLDEARQAVWDLRHGDAEGDLVSSLREFAARLGPESPVKIGVEVTGQAVRLDGRAERNLLLVAREAIRNALSHAHPARIDLRLRYEPRDVCLEVQDDGRGFPSACQPEPGHYGIIGMRERVEELGGSLEIESEPGRGCRLRARMPVQVQA